MWCGRSQAPDASNLADMLSVLRTKTAGWVNRLDHAPGRKVWFNYRFKIDQVTVYDEFAADAEW